MAGMLYDVSSIVETIVMLHKLRLTSSGKTGKEDGMVPSDRALLIDFIFCFASSFCYVSSFCFGFIAHRPTNR
jgi:hypothetical protein